MSPRTRRAAPPSSPMALLLAVLSLIGAQLAGELVQEIFHLPLPGPVIGMFLLAAALVLHDRNKGSSAGNFRISLEKTATTLLAHMGLLFVPAGVGIVAEAALLRQEWFPIVAALLGSTVLGIAVTGLVMHFTLHFSAGRPMTTSVVAGEPRGAP